MKKKYANLDPAYAPPGKYAAWRFLLRRLSRRLSPRPEVDGIRPVAGNRELLAPYQGNTAKNLATWVGHSTVLCRHEGYVYLTDPIFSDHAGPARFVGPRRHTPPAFKPPALPKVDFVLISHDHYDHLDLASVRALRKKDDPLFLVPEGLARWFRLRGFHRVVEVPWWGEYRMGHLTITALPAQHYSVRTPWNKNKSHWCGWLVQGRKTFYYPGDTGYHPMFKEVGRKFGPVDMAALPIGAYAPRRIIRQNHITPEEALDIFADVAAKKMLAVHWGAFDMTEEPLLEPPARLAAEARKRGVGAGAVNAVRLGETLEW